jgi:hypothetical protein
MPLRMLHIAFICAGITCKIARREGKRVARKVKTSGANCYKCLEFENGSKLAKTAEEKLRENHTSRQKLIDRLRTTGKGTAMVQIRMWAFDNLPQEKGGWLLPEGDHNKSQKAASRRIAKTLCIAVSKPVGDGGDDPAYGPNMTKRLIIQSKAI